MADASSAQLLYVEHLLTLSGASRLSIGDVVSADDASAAIEQLQRLAPIQANSRAGVFASLKTAGKTKDCMYGSLGISSLSDGAGATEYDAARCRRWIDGFVTEVRHPATLVTAPELFAPPVLGSPPPDEGLDDLASMERAMHLANGSRTPLEQPKAAPVPRPGRFPARHPVVVPAAAPAAAPIPMGRPPARHPVAVPAAPAPVRVGLFARAAEDPQPDNRPIFGAPPMTPAEIARAIGGEVAAELRAQGLRRRLLDSEHPAMVIGCGDKWAASFDCEALTPSEERRFRSWAESQIADMRPGDKSRILDLDQLPASWSTPDAVWRMSA